MTRTIDVFFFPGSTYTFLTALRITGAAAEDRFEIRWRPFNVRAIMIEMDNIPFAKKPAKARYMWRDIERRAHWYGLPWNGAPPYPVDPDLLALRVAAVAARDGWCADFIEASYRAWFVDHAIPGLAETTRKAIASIGRDPDAVIAEAETPELRSIVDATTDEARRLGIFGSPTFVVGDEIFWGDDRLDDAVRWLEIKHPTV